MASLDVVRVPAWSRQAWLIHGFSTRSGGKTTVYRSGNTDLNLGFTNSDDPNHVTENRSLFVSAATEGKEILGMVTLRQIHSSLIRRVTAQDIPSVWKGNGLMTDQPGVLLGIQTADC